MLKSLKDLFDSLMPPPPSGDAQSDEHALREKFALGPDEAARLAELAETAAHQATDLYTFTSRIDERFGMERKIRMIELMWRIAYADGHLSDHERHVMWRIADLLHVPQGAYVHARMRARDASAS